jgi:hypothetical protein
MLENTSLIDLSTIKMFFLWLFMIYFSYSFTVSIQGILGGGEDDLEIECEKTNDIIIKPTIPYDDKYKDKFHELMNIESKMVGDKKELKKEHYDGLTMVIEHTPMGNVMMTWDTERKTFIYYADSTIPYRYLEVVARKFVTTNQTPELFVDMELEIKKGTEAKNERLRLEKEENEKMAIHTIDENTSTDDIPPKKKNVFAKFKDYNKNSIKSSKVPSKGNKQPPSSRNTSVDTREKKDIILKDKSNRYSCEGKIINFPFLKKPKRKEIDTRAATSFAEFNKLRLTQNKT